MISLIKTNVQEDGIMFINFNRPPVNALSTDFIKELKDIFLDINKQKNIRVVIINSLNDNFCAGADLKERKIMSLDGADIALDNLNECFNLIENCRVPTIAAINGYALGGGCELAMSCHIRYATSNAVLGQPEVKLGLITGFGGSQRITKNLSKTNAMEMLLSGRNYTAQACKKIGLINDFFESKNELFDRVNFISKLISENGSNSVEKTIELINRSYDIHTDEGLTIESIEFGKLFEEQESNEGLESFIQKRKPNF